MKKILCLILLSGFLGSGFAQTAERKNLLEARSIALEGVKQETMQSAYIQQELPGRQTAVSGRKSGGLAILYSLLLPGMGELYAGSYESGKYFTIAEGALWGVYAGFKIYGNWQRDNYKSFALTHGNINPAIDDADLYADMGDYVSVDAYNTSKALQAEFNEMYDAKVRYWSWADNQQRKEYRNMWVSSEQAFNNVRFAVAGMVVNRIISAINAARMVSKYNKGLTGEDKSMKMSFISGSNTGMNGMPNTVPSDFSLVLFKPL